MAGNHRFTGSFIHSGSDSDPAIFKSGIIADDFLKTNQSIDGRLIGDGSLLTGLNFTGGGIRLFVGSQSMEDGIPKFSSWVTGSIGNHKIRLSTSSSNGMFNHFTFLRVKNGQLEEVSDYIGSQKGLASNNFFEETLGTGQYRYLLIASSTASRETVTAGVTVIINPDKL